jgi:hypothetical protein
MFQPITATGITTGKGRTAMKVPTVLTWYRKQSQRKIHDNIFDRIYVGYANVNWRTGVFMTQVPQGLSMGR